MAPQLLPVQHPVGICPLPRGPLVIQPHPPSHLYWCRFCQTGPDMTSRCQDPSTGHLIVKASVTTDTLYAYCGSVQKRSPVLRVCLLIRTGHHSQMLLESQLIALLAMEKNASTVSWFCRPSHAEVKSVAFLGNCGDRGGGARSVTMATRCFLRKSREEDCIEKPWNRQLLD